MRLGIDHGEMDRTRVLQKEYQFSLPNIRCNMFKESNHGSVCIRNYKWNVLVEQRLCQKTIVVNVHIVVPFRVRIFLNPLTLGSYLLHPSRQKRDGIGTRLIFVNRDR